MWTFFHKLGSPKHFYAISARLLPWLGWITALLLLAGQGEAMLNRLLLFDALSMEWQGVTLPKNPNCPACGNS